MNAFDKSSDTVHLPHVLDISVAHSFYEMLLAKSVKEIKIIDASAVESITTPAFQIILAAMSIGYEVISPSPAFLAAAADLGLKRLFDSKAA